MQTDTQLHAFAPPLTLCLADAPAAPESVAALLVAWHRLAAADAQRGQQLARMVFRLGFLFGASLAQREAVRVMIAGLLAEFPGAPPELVGWFAKRAFLVMVGRPIRIAEGVAHR